MNQAWYDFLQTLGNTESRLDTFLIRTPDENEQLLKQGTSLIPITQLAFIKVSGQDAKNFLQGQLTCDVGSLSPHTFTFGAHCTVKGKIHNFYRIGQFPGEDSGYLLVTHQSMLTSAITHLQKYALFSQVEITDITQTYACLCLIGLTELLEDTLKISLNTEPTHLAITTQALHPHSLLLKLRGQDDRTLLIAPATHLIEFWNLHLKKIAILNGETWDLLEIRAGIPVITPQTVDAFFPHDLNLPALDAVSFKKGCYLGQEVITRMQFRGKSNRHLYRAMIERDQLPQNLSGEAIFSQDSQKEVGTVLASARTSKQQTEMLAVVHNQYQSFVNLYLSSKEERFLQHLSLDYE